MVQIAVTNVKLGQRVVTVTVSAQPTSNLNRSRKRQYQYLVMQVKIPGEEVAISKGLEMENTILDNELILFDRLNVIKDVYNKYDYEKNGYISFSGGKDSTIIHYLFDMAVPGNRVPRVYSNTGIEYNNVVDHVKKMQEKDDRIIILEPKKNIQKTLKENGYPFKSKEHSRIVGYYQSNQEDINKRLNEIESDKKLLSEYEYIHNLPRGSKTVVKYIYGVRERERESCTSSIRCPDSLRYQFTKDFDIKISDKCCLLMKEQPLMKWAKDNNRNHTVLGLRTAEGGRRALRGKCQSVIKGQYKFSPLIKVTDEWEEWFIDKYKVELCDLYKEPYNFDRTGCKGCPFTIDLQQQLNTMEEKLPAERKQCEIIWKPVYEEYRRIGYRLDKDDGQMSIFDFIGGR